MAKVQGAAGPSSNSGVGLLEAPPRAGSPAEREHFAEWEKELQRGKPGGGVEVAPRTARPTVQEPRTEFDAKAARGKSSKRDQAKAAGLSGAAGKAAKASRGRHPPRRLPGGLMATAAVAAVPAGSGYVVERFSSDLHTSQRNLGKQLMLGTQAEGSTFVADCTALAKDCQQYMANHPWVEQGGPLQKSMLSDETLERLVGGYGNHGIASRAKVGAELAGTHMQDAANKLAAAQEMGTGRLAGRQLKDAAVAWDASRGKGIDTIVETLNVGTKSQLNAFAPDELPEPMVKATRNMAESLFDSYTEPFKGMIDKVTQAEQKIQKFVNWDMAIKGGVGALNTGLAVSTLRSSATKKRKAAACAAAALGWLPLAATVVPQLAAINLAPVTFGAAAVSLLANRWASTPAKSDR